MRKTTIRRLTFQSWERHRKRNCARLEFLATIKAKPDPNSNPAGTSVSSVEGTASGVAWFDPELGTTIETTRQGRRDLALLATLYDTAARVQELADLTVRDIQIGRAHV